MNKKLWLTVVLVVAALAAGGIITQGANNPIATKSSKLHIVAGENFWGSLVSQIGGSQVDVTTIVSDPNADPHEFASNTATARAFSEADYVILNGAGYDSWGNHLLNATQSTHRKVLTIAELIGKKEGDNPHFWYSPTYVNRAIAKMESDLIAIDPSHKALFEQQYAKLQTALASYQ